MSLIDNTVNARGTPNRDQGNLIAWPVSGEVRKPSKRGQVPVSYGWGGPRPVVPGLRLG